jgi:uncharacterized protein YuzB (UPF0349 family)
VVNATNTVQMVSWVFEYVYTSGMAFMKAQGMQILDNNQTSDMAEADVTSRYPEYVSYCGEVKNGYYALVDGKVCKASINFKLTAVPNGLVATICNCNAGGDDVCDMLKAQLDIRLNAVKNMLESGP